MSCIMHATYTKPASKSVRRHPGMSVKRVMVNDKKGNLVAMFVCAKNNTHDMVAKRVVRGNG
jgi:hypothetical protein